MKPLLRFLAPASLALALLNSPLAGAGDGKNLVQNFDFEQAGDQATTARGFVLTGDSIRTFVGAS